MTLTDEDKHWIEAAIEESSKRFEHQFKNLIQSFEREMAWIAKPRRSRQPQRTRPGRSPNWLGG
jgi:hypothetical protein